MRTTAIRLGATLVVLVSVFAAPCLAVMSNGDFVATGYFFGSIDFGTGKLTAASPGVTDCWIARFNRAGQIKWAKRFGSSNGDSGNSVAVDASGNIYLL